MAGAGDVDGDGYDDVIVGSPLDPVMGGNSGAATLYYGSVTGIDATAGELLWAADGTGSDYFGWAVAGVGDVDGDGADDLLVGSPAYLSTSRNGSAYLRWGACAEDTDGDGYCADVDCDDDDPDTYPGATEVVGDEVDQDCDGVETCYADADDDGYTDGSTTVASSDTDCTDAGEGLATDPTGECDDTDATIHPGATEGVGDEVDQDCDGTEICHADLDSDGYTSGTVPSADTDCADTGEATAATSDVDCDDDAATTYPGATEVVGDEVDQDCDDAETCFADADDDGYTDGSTTVYSLDTDCVDAGEGTASDPTGECDDADGDADDDEDGDDKGSSCATVGPVDAGLWMLAALGLGLVPRRRRAGQ